ncbi:uncharacterized protein LOC131153668 [Malania oleifera]|uniref:uncharacterized protein LOC131153668 n=1 Tax=Malania oleifera TaxID=397392 RepID=UPI0025AE7CC7|nr:uncharacterized protein LOC131153668 [Malania oleifera]
MNVLNRPYAYSKMDSEDPEERKHRRAQFLIYKALKKADVCRRRPSCLRVRICRLKIKIGRRLKRLRGSVLLSMSIAKARLQRQVSSRLKAIKRLLRSGNETMASFPPLFST